MFLLIQGVEKNKERFSQISGRFAIETPCFDVALDFIRCLSCVATVENSDGLIVQIHLTRLHEASGTQIQPERNGGNQ